MLIQLMHSSSCGFGSHSPFLIQVAELVPLSLRPAGQVNWTVAPSIGRPLYITLGLESLYSKYPQLAVIVTVYDT